jgi:hypothetical protein
MQGIFITFRDICHTSIYIAAVFLLLASVLSKGAYLNTHTHTQKQTNKTRIVTHRNLDTIVGTVLSINQSVQNKECIIVL